MRLRIPSSTVSDEDNGAAVRRARGRSLVDKPQGFGSRCGSPHRLTMQLCLLWRFFGSRQVGVSPISGEGSATAAHGAEYGCFASGSPKGLCVICVGSFLQNVDPIIFRLPLDSGSFMEIDLKKVRPSARRNCSPHPPYIHSNAAPQ